MPTKKAPARAKKVATIVEEDDPAKRLDPGNSIGLASGESLTPRMMPRDVVYMLDLSDKETPIELWRCEAWKTAGVDDIVLIPGERWAIGVWDEKWGRYKSNPTPNGFRLKEVSKVDVIGLCNRAGNVYPIKILCEMSAEHLKPSTTPKPEPSKQPQFPENAIPCSQTALTEFRGQSNHGGTAESLKERGILTYAEWFGRESGKQGTLWVVFRIAQKHEEFRKFMEERGKARKNVE